MAALADVTMDLTHPGGARAALRDPLYRWDDHFPAQMNKLSLSEFDPKAALRIATSPTDTRAARVRRMRDRNAARFKTQPITFEEIREIDEDSSAGDGGKASRTEPPGGAAGSQADSGQQGALRRQTSELEDLKQQLVAFSRSLQPPAASDVTRDQRQLSTGACAEQPPVGPVCEPGAAHAPSQWRTPSAALLQADISQNPSRSRQRRQRQAGKPADPPVSGHAQGHSPATLTEQGHSPATLTEQ